MLFYKRDFEAARLGMEMQIKQLTKEVSRMGSNNIVCRRHGDRLHYVEKHGSKEKGITRNKKRIYMLTRREYLLEELKLLKANLKIISFCANAYQDISDEIILHNMSERFAHLPVYDILMRDADKWMEKPFKQNRSHSEHKRYITTNGVVVRSKSEREIGNALEAAGLKYKYDVQIKCGETVWHADFVIYRSDGTEVIWEHLGKLNDSVYSAINSQRIKDYITVLGKKPWDDLIWTTESDIEDSRTIRTIIRRFLID